MQVLLNTGANIDGSHEMADHVTTVVTDALSHFRDHVTRVEAHLSDVNSHAKAGADDIHCTLEARLVGHPPIAVKEHAATAHQAIQGAAGKLKRAVTTAVSKHDPRRNTGLSGSAEADATADFPG